MTANLLYQGLPRAINVSNFQLIVTELLIQGHKLHKPFYKSSALFYLIAFAPSVIESNQQCVGIITYVYCLCQSNNTNLRIITINISTFFFCVFYLYFKLVMQLHQYQMLPKTHKTCTDFGNFIGFSVTGCLQHGCDYVLFAITCSKAVLKRY